ncbi:uncharacterized protein LOC132392217 [Hypanus sabinus]|uniref:uncharacterized protein LOC132392217 n=1 Tax=Hypanus sabinus TaxID=79690 RepID=UPI0028C42F7C|nr:uncharacterized protein LOC132392217 [Hypanus sabinus]
METVLRSERLDLDPQDPEAALAFEHWLACFQSYLAELRATDPAVMYRILFSRVTPKVYSIIQDLPTYEGALDALKRQYLWPVNTVYARHRLATRQQRPGESSTGFLRALQTLVRACDCKTLTAEQHAELLVRGAFVMGLRSVYVRQRLMEHSDLTLCDRDGQRSGSCAALRRCCPVARFPAGSVDASDPTAGSRERNRHCQSRFHELPEPDHSGSPSEARALLFLWTQKAPSKTLPSARSDLLQLRKAGPCCQGPCIKAIEV